MTNFSGERFPFAACGDDVTIYGHTQILGAEAMRVGSHVIVDDFVFIDGRAGLTIGDHVHIAGFVSIIGQGECVLGDFAGLAAGTRLVTGTDIMDGSGLTGPTIPDEFRSVHRGRIEIGRHAVVGTNSVVHPDVTIGDGAIIGSGSVVTRDIPAWSIALGAPARVVGQRDQANVERLEAELRSQRG